MKTPTPIDNLLNKKMDRRDFLKHVGVGILGLAGVGAALKIIGYEIQDPSSSLRGSVSNYGTSSYGGRTK